MAKYELATSARWPLENLGEAVEALISAHSGNRLISGKQASTIPLSAASTKDEPVITEWLDSAASHYGWEAEATHASYADFENLLRAVAPAILRIPSSWNDGEPHQYPDGTQGHFLAITKATRSHLTLLQPDLKTQRVALSNVRDLLSDSLTQPHTASLNRILDRSNVDEERHDRVRQSLLTEMVGTTPITGCWRLRLSAGAPLWQQIHSVRSPWRTALMSGLTTLQLLITIGAWWVIGRGALAGHFEWGWVLGWALMLLTTIPIQLGINGLQSELVLAISTLFKERLLFGALQLRPEAVRLEGAGHFLGRVFSADALEQLSMAGGVIAVLALIQLLIAGAVLALGAGGWGHVLLLGGWTLAMLLLGWRVYSHGQRIHRSRRSLTNDLVERMVGHRTRLIQETPSRWHADEDRDLAAYQQQLAASDRATSRFKALIPRGWMAVGMTWFFVVLLTGEHSVASIAISLGGVLFARQAFSSIVLGTQSIVGALLAWADVKPIFAAATLPTPGAILPANVGTHSSEAAGGDGYGDGRLRQVRPTSGNEQKSSVLTLRNVGFRYPNREESVLEKCSLQVRLGDRLLLQGPSGGGKSTLVNLMAGLESADRGTLLINGTDHKTVSGEAWRRRVVAVPQFHQNHVLTGTLAFNLLMGKSWPASPAELKRAELVCQALGMGDLLKRMPAGLQQMVGEGGWQLSHGERSRLYIARAILQDADLVILDESFGALDPESLGEALEAVLEEVPTLMVVAHP